MPRRAWVLSSRFSNCNNWSWERRRERLMVWSVFQEATRGQWPFRRAGCIGNDLKSHFCGLWGCQWPPRSLLTSNLNCLASISMFPWLSGLYSQNVPSFTNKIKAPHLLHTLDFGGVSHWRARRYRPLVKIKSERQENMPFSFYTTFEVNIINLHLQR